MGKAVQEIRVVGGIPTIYRWNGWDIKAQIPLTSEPIDIVRENGNTVMDIQGKRYDVCPTSDKPPAVYVWAEHHAHANRTNPYDHFIAQASFIMQRGIKRVIHEFFGDFIYDPSTKIYSKRPKAASMKTNSPISAEDFRKDVNNAKRWNHVVEAKFFQDLANIIGFTIVGCDSDTERPDYVERETEQYEVIEKYQGTPEEPVLAVVGSAHCREVSYLTRLLKEKDFAAIIRDPEITEECEADALEGLIRCYPWEKQAQSA